jgi:hypothetical protein
MQLACLCCFLACVFGQIRKGNKTVDLYSTPSIRKVNIPSEMTGWWKGEVEKAQKGSAS